MLATLSATQAWLVGVLLLACRLGGLLLMTPPLSAAFVPAGVRVAFVLALAALLAVPVSPTPDIGPLLSAVASEAALGATMGLGVSLAFGAFAVAGRMLDTQIGFGLGQVFDPLTRQQLPVLTGAFNMLALVLFFSSNAHHALLRGFALSVERFPVGGGWLLENAAGPLLHEVSATFSLGFAMVAPVVLCLFLIELGLGALARNMPQMNMFALAIPLKVVVGLGALSLSVAGMAGVAARLNESIFKAWEALFR